MNIPRDKKKSRKLIKFVRMNKIQFQCINIGGKSESFLKLGTESQNFVFKTIFSLRNKLKFVINVNLITMNFSVQFQLINYSSRVLNITIFFLITNK